MLICHDLAAFSRRSEATRGEEREEWARQLDSEVPRDGSMGVVHPIHYLDKPSQGKVFTSGMSSLIDSGLGWGISTFNTRLSPKSQLQELQKVEARTARFAGPTLDLYVYASESRFA